MSFLDVVRNALALPALAAGMPVESPWASPNHLLPATLPSWADNGRVSRSAAMSVPTIKRSRNLIAATISRLPIEATRAGEPLDAQPTWLSRTDGPVSPFHRMLWTIDDLLFYGASLWAVERNHDGSVQAVDRVPYSDWAVIDGTIHHNGQPVNADSVCYIPGLEDGLITGQPDTVRQAIDLHRAAGRAASTPSAQIELKQVGGPPMSNADIDALVARWIAARRGENQGVAFTNQSIEVKEHGDFQEHLLIDGRNAAAVECARAMGIPASMIDAQLPHASMDYSNREMRNSEFIDLCLAPIMSAITGRLGLDDMVPRGVAVRFNTSDISNLTVDHVDTPDDIGGSPQ